MLPTLKNINYQKYITYMLIAYAFSFPISKAATNLFEVLAIILWILEGNWKEKFQLYKSNLLSLSIILLIAFSVISILWHGNAEISFKYIAKYRHLLIIFIFYSSFDVKYRKHIISAFFLSMFLSELMSYAIFFEIIHYKNILPQDPTPFMSHMTYSTVLAFTISIIMIRFFYEQNSKYKFFYIFFFITATTNLFINGGRSGQVLFIILVFIAILSSIEHKVKAFLISITILLSTLFLAYSLSPNFQKRSYKLYNDFNNVIVHNNYEGSGGARIALTTIGIQTFLDNPLLGTGISYHMHNLESYIDKNNFNKKLKKYADYHNGFLTVSVQLGIIGLLISILIIYSLFSLQIRDKEYKILSLLFATTFVLFSFTHNTFHTMNPMIFFALFAGYFNALSREKSRN